jgi:hypothetical protein
MQETDHSNSINAGAAPPSTLEQQQQQQLQEDEQLCYIRWLLQLSYPCLSAVVGLLHQFHSLTGICPLQGKQRSPKLHMLLLFLQLSADLAVDSSSSSSSSFMQPAQQLLQAARWPSTAQQPYHQPGNESCIASCAAAAMKPGEAFAAAVQLLQAAATLHGKPQAAAAAAEATANPTTGNCSSNSNRPYWQQQAAAAGRFLQAAYGWMHLDGRPAAMAVGYPAGNATAAAAAARPCETPYDCCMMELVHHMLQGPSGKLLNDERHAAQPIVAAAAEGAPACNGQDLTKGFERQQQQLWEDWCDSDGFRALAVLVAGYDKPQQLVRGLVALVVHELQHQQQQGLVKGSSDAEKAAIKKVSCSMQQ